MKLLPKIRFEGIVTRLFFKGKSSIYTDNYLNLSRRIFK
jgi:hypothetical protein